MSLTYELSFIQKPGYLHAIVHGKNTKENVRGYLQEILRECVGTDYQHVLIEEHLQGPRLRTMDVFHVAAEGTGHAVGHFKAIAYVDANAEGNLMYFAEDVAVNRGLPIKVFPSVSAAEKWLQREDKNS
jgi:hypothetical protein